MTIVAMVTPVNEKTVGDGEGSQDPDLNHVVTTLNNMNTYELIQSLSLVFGHTRGGWIKGFLIQRSEFTD